MGGWVGGFLWEQVAYQWLEIMFLESEVEEEERSREKGG